MTSIIVPAYVHDFVFLVMRQIKHFVSNGLQTIDLSLPLFVSIIRIHSFTNLKKKKIIQRGNYMIPAKYTHHPVLFQLTVYEDCFKLEIEASEKCLSVCAFNSLTRTLQQLMHQKRSKFHMISTKPLKKSVRKPQSQYTTESALPKKLFLIAMLITSY